MQAYEKLEQELAEWSGLDDVVVCSSGSAALHLALEALELPLGSKVIVPEFCMIACARAVVLAGLVPVFVDCGDDLLMHHSKVTEAMGRSAAFDHNCNCIKAIMAVHIYGRRCDMNWLTSLDIPVIEDLAEAHGITPHPKSAAACWSFYRNKIVAGEEGGAVCFPKANSYPLTWGLKYQVARELRCQGFTDKHDFIHRPRGCSYRLSNANAQLIKTKTWWNNTELRRERERWYNELIPKQQQRGRRDAPWVYDVFHQEAHRIVDELNESGIRARRAFAPMSMQPEFRQPYKHLNAFKAYESVLYLPLDPSVTHKEVEIAAHIVTA